MSSEIQFGDLEHSQPQRGLRPDQDAHFSTATVGRVDDDELLIFVDLDVLRDMEAHAVSNTRVELGGVMLGHQLIDDQGRPFVLITDCLRAEHYEATKGSFKFTHETWSQITRQRDQFRPDLEMVGWYHTHPGWSVFLSGMDLFICNNFFNRPLDVALVIDPCEQDRGWFQWTDDEKPKTQRTNGFVLTTSRFRQLELDQFARIYNKEPAMNLDPRYSGNSLGNSMASTPVTLMDNRKPTFDLAVIGMLSLQFLLMALLAWKVLSGPGENEGSEVAKLQEQVNSLSSENARSMREDAYKEVLNTIVASQTGDADIVSKFTDMKVSNQRMQANLEGQLALSEKLAGERNKALSELEDRTILGKKLEKQLFEARTELKESGEKIAEFEKDGAALIPPGSIAMPWWWIAIGALVTTVLGGALGFAMGRKEGDYDYPAEQPPSDKANFAAEETVFETSSPAAEPLKFTEAEAKNVTNG